MLLIQGVLLLHNWMKLFLNWYYNIFSCIIHIHNKVMLQKYGNIKLRPFEILALNDNAFGASRMKPGGTQTDINVLKVT